MVRAGDSLTGVCWPGVCGSLSVMSLWNEGNRRFGGQGKNEGRLMSVSEGVGAEVYFGAVFRRYLYTFECYTIALVRPPVNLTQL